MKLWIPAVTEQLKLTEDWEFPLFLERRNDALVARVDPTIGVVGYGRADESIGCCLPAGTILSISRHYIRSGRQSAWNSLTFIIKFTPGDKERPKYNKAATDPTPQKLKGARFWAKLSNVNEIVCEPIAEKDRVK